MDVENASREELDALRAAFGVDDGGASALGWEGVRAFEAECGVVLPEPYRTFVAEVADGSPLGPPEFGLVSLGGAGGDDGRSGQKGRNGRRERELGRPFPLTDAWVWEDDPRPVAEIDPVLERVFDDGSVVLGTDGCGMYWHLVVSGPQRGHVWLITGEGAVPFGAEFGHTGGDAGFAGWVRHWATDRPWFDEG
ncbi:SMI1/KNR4 family protein [Streptomyces sp. NBC_00448]|uniref:SMI1/KNR4 family protein n=1 Tax=Streptomyces sp. NBC_00448 TaxID=2903652 RepID=UPI002E2379C9